MYEQQTVTELLSSLIKIPSVNAEVVSDSVGGGERQIADFLAKWLEAHGAEVTLQEAEKDRYNVIGRWAPVDGRHRILFAPHLDTVSVEGMTISPFSGEVREGKIWGRGASDTKGTMAAMLWALKEFRSEQVSSAVAVDFVAFCGEETGMLGSQTFLSQNEIEYQLAVVGEPTNLNVVYATKGTSWITVQARGVAAHSSDPERGENAIIKLFKGLEKITQRFDDQTLQWQHPKLGLPTCNIGTIEGGTQPNIVPDRASAQLDFRTTPGFFKSVGGIVKWWKANSGDLDLELVEYREIQALETSLKNNFLKEILKLSLVKDPVAVAWCSDASYLAAAGIPSICLGPGSIKQAHTKDEWLLVADLKLGRDCYRDLLKAWFSQS